MQVMVGEVIVCVVVFDVVAIDVVAIDVVVIDVVVIGVVVIGVVVIGVVVIGVVVIGVGAIGVEVGIEAETSIGSSLFALVDAAPVVMPLVSFLICWMMRLTMSHRAMVLGEAC